MGLPSIPETAERLSGWRQLPGGGMDLRDHLGISRWRRRGILPVVTAIVGLGLAPEMTQDSGALRSAVTDTDRTLSDCFTATGTVPTEADDPAKTRVREIALPDVTHT